MSVDSSLQQWLSKVNDIVGPQQPTPQKVVFKLAPEDISGMSDEEFVDALEILPETEAPATSQEQNVEEAMEVDQAVHQPVLNVMAEVGYYELVFDRLIVYETYGQCFCDHGVATHFFGLLQFHCNAKQRHFER